MAHQSSTTSGDYAYARVPVSRSKFRPVFEVFFLSLSGRALRLRNSVPPCGEITVDSLLGATAANFYAYVEIPERETCHKDWQSHRCRFSPSVCASVPFPFKCLYVCQAFISVYRDPGSLLFVRCRKTNARDFSAGKEMNFAKSALPPPRPPKTVLFSANETFSASPLITNNKRFCE